MEAAAAAIVGMQEKALEHAKQGLSEEARTQVSDHVAAGKAAFDKVAKDAAVRGDDIMGLIQWVWDHILPDPAAAQNDVHLWELREAPFPSLSPSLSLSDILGLSLGQSLIVTLRLIPIQLDLTCTRLHPNRRRRRLRS